MSFNCCGENVFKYLDCLSTIAGTISKVTPENCCKCQDSTVGDDNFVYNSCCAIGIPKSFCIRLTAASNLTTYLAINSYDLTMTYANGSWSTEEFSLIPSSSLHSITGCDSFTAHMTLSCDSGSWTVSLIADGATVFNQPIAIPCTTQWSLYNSLISMDGEFPNCPSGSTGGNWGQIRLDFCDSVVDFSAGCGCLPLPKYLTCTVETSNITCLPVGTNWVATYDPSYVGAAIGQYYYTADVSGLDCNLGPVAAKCFAVRYIDTGCRFDYANFGDGAYGTSCYPWFPTVIITSETIANSYCVGSTSNPTGPINFVMSWSSGALQIRIQPL